MSQSNDEQKKASPKPLEDAIAELGRAAFEQPAICTGWVLVSEWFGGNDEYWIVNAALKIEFVDTVGAEGKVIIDVVVELAPALFPAKIVVT